MYILTINVGSSSTKFGLFIVEFDEIKKIDRTSIDAGVEKIPSFITSILAEHTINLSNVIFAIRVVHGGPDLIHPTVITPSILSYLEDIQALAPLHNPLAMKVINQLNNVYPNNVVVAAFDTMFHASMPAVASSYALPYELMKKHAIKRYGFHGFAYASMVNLFSEQLQISPEKVTIIALQLGSGCSICAIQNGKSVDTSMGFSPLEGLISRTRTGTIDPTVLSYLHEKTQMPYNDLFDLFNNESGLKGLSSSDGHMSSLMDSVDEHKQLAVDLFIYRIQQYIGAYDVVLGQQSPILLAGGISEHMPIIWERIFNNPFLQVTLSPTSSVQLQEPLTRISSDSSRRHAYIAFVDEEYEIANSVNGMLKQQKNK